ncbi:MAG: ribosomal protein S18-alanine N-acetyltransferase [Gammaproteobacteria bacterium]|nr:ribosomal protein S18-alanine N-acetyltransferase [Gammaproteobacteria bacterium]
MALNPDIEPIASFRAMISEDVPRVIEIEESVYSHPWTEGIFRDCICVGYNCFVYEVNEIIQAYGLITIAADEAHILNLCVAPQMQGQGMGRKMLYKLLDVAEEKKVDSIFLEVRGSNTVAIQLYEQEGFNKIGVRKDYYPSDNGREDALVFAKALNLPNET